MRSDVKRARAALSHIEEHALLMQDFIKGTHPESFLKDQKTIFAVVRCLEVISEASRRLPEWVKIAAAGNIYRHEYDDLDVRLVWQTVEKALSNLLPFAQKELPRLLKATS